MKKRLISCFLILFATAALLTISASAVGGSCGKNVSWSLSGSTLTISGTGAMEAYDYSYDSDEPVFAPWEPYSNKIKTVIVQSGVTSIGKGAFYSCSALESVTLPNSITTIDTAAFSYCRSLQSITIPQKVTTIGNGAFLDCTSLTSISIPDSVTSLGHTVFCGCTSLTSATIGSGITTLGGNLFKDTALKSIVIPDNVKTIDSCVFQNCSSLEDVTIGSGVTTIGFQAFVCCESLNSITLPKNLTQIQGSAFMHCYGLTSITIPAKVSSLNSDAFFRCDNLMDITVDPDNKHYSSVNGVLFNKSQTDLLWYPSGRTGSYTVPDGVSALRSYAFSFCSGLTDINLPDSVNKIADHAFYQCTNLSTISIPRGVTMINPAVFYGCSKLKSIVIPSGVDTFYGSVFAGCSSMEWIRFTGSFPFTFNEYAFNGVTATVYYPADDASWSEDVRQNYMGTITWEPYNPAPAPKINVGLNSNDKPKITWSAVDGAQKYIIFRSVNGEPFEKFYTTTRTILTNSSAERGNAYAYKVCAVVDEVEGRLSNAGSVTVPELLPAPQIKVILNSKDKPRITWSAVEGAEKYIVYRSVNGGAFKAFYTTAGTLLTNTSATEGNTYAYKVCAVADGKEGEFSQTGTVTLPAPLPAPQIKVVLNSKDKPKITWSAVEGAEKYIVYRSVNGGTFNAFYTTTGTLLTNTSATEGNTYAYKVCAAADGKEGKFSQTETVTVPLPAPQIKVVLNSKDKPRITWSAVEGAEEYIVYRAVNGGAFKAFYTTTRTVLTNSSAEAGSTYAYKVCAVADGAKGKFSNSVSISVP